MKRFIWTMALLLSVGLMACGGNTKNQQDASGDNTAKEQTSSGEGSSGTGGNEATQQQDDAEGEELSSSETGGEGQKGDDTEANETASGAQSTSIRTSGQKELKKTYGQKDGWQNKPEEALLKLPAQPDPDPNEMINVDTDPKLLNESQVRSLVKYPAAAKSDGAEGTVALKILVDRRGRYKKHVLRTSPDPRLTKALVEAVQYVRYKPAMHEGQPVKAWETFKYTFQK